MRTRGCCLSGCNTNHAMALGAVFGLLSVRLSSATVTRQLVGLDRLFTITKIADNRKGTEPRVRSFRQHWLFFSCVE